MTTSAMASRMARLASSMLVGLLLCSLGLGPVAYAQDAPPVGGSTLEAPPAPPADGAPMPGEAAPAAPEAMPPPPPPVEAQPPQAPPPPLPPPAARSNIPSYILWATGGASLILGAAFGIAAISAKSDFDDNPTLSKADDVNARAVMADVGLGLGVILAVTGTIFFLVDDQPSEGAAPTTGQATRDTRRAGRGSRRTGGDLRVEPLVGARAGGGVLTLRF